jgi:hypothetical protein
MQTLLAHVTGQDCHGPTHQWVGQGSSLHVLDHFSGLSVTSHITSSTMVDVPSITEGTAPTVDSRQRGLRCWTPPPQVAEHCDQSPIIHVYLSWWVVSRFQIEYLYSTPGLCTFPLKITCEIQKGGNEFSISSGRYNDTKAPGGGLQTLSDLVHVLQL